MTKTHKYADALADLQALVAERGEDFVYQSPEPDSTDLPTCRYEFDGLPSCGLGKVFGETWAVPLSVLEGLDTGTSPGQALKDEGHLMTRKAWTLLFAFQDRQDSGLPYGEAIREAIATTESEPGLSDNDIVTDRTEED